ncbi:MAG: 50S ribosomal protein L10 [Metamycoplasmataceae bacterium]
MNKFQKEKRETVKEIKNKIESSKSMIIAQYDTITVKGLQQLRKQAKEKDVFIKVYKNRLVKKAIESTDLESLSGSLVGQNLFAFANSESISAAKVLAEFAKKNSALQLKEGIFENKVISHEEVMVIATLPSYEEALTMLASSLLGGLKQLSIGLKMLVDENHITQK